MHSSSPHSCYMPCRSHSPRLDHSNYTWRRVQVMKLLITHFSVRRSVGQYSCTNCMASLFTRLQADVILSRCVKGSEYPSDGLIGLRSVTVLALQSISKLSVSRSVDHMRWTNCMASLFTRLQVDVRLCSKFVKGEVFQPLLSRIVDDVQNKITEYVTDVTPVVLLRKWRLIIDGTSVVSQLAAISKFCRH
jgi:hypothetical protein